MLPFALLLNIAILMPVVWTLANGSAQMELAFGADTVARRILLCIYAAIAVISAALLVLFAVNHHWAVPMTLALFAVQIVYKIGTAPLVGLSHPVVATNMLVVVVQILAILVTWRSGSLTP